MVGEFFKNITIKHKLAPDEPKKYLIAERGPYTMNLRLTPNFHSGRIRSHAPEKKRREEKRKSLATVERTGRLDIDDIFYSNSSRPPRVASRAKLTHSRQLELLPHAASPSWSPLSLILSRFLHLSCPSHTTFSSWSPLFLPVLPLFYLLLPALSLLFASSFLPSYSS